MNIRIFMKKSLFACLVFLVTYTTATAQEISISGNVYSATDKQPIPFVNIVAEGTQQGTSTDVDGQFRITVQPEINNLIFSYVGYQIDTVAIDGRTEIDVYLQPSQQLLDEVVVTALGIKRDKKALGYSVQKVSSDELQVTRDPSVINQLSGKVTGLQVSATNAGAGSSSRIVLRGNNSFLGDNNALVVVDGVPIENSTISNAEETWGGRDYGNGISDVNPDDIESISVLKGASASALYGSRAANGVILITTKKGNRKKGIGVSFSNNTSIDNAYIHYDLQNEYGAGRNGKFFPPFILNQDGIPAYNVNSASAFGSWGPKMEGQEIIGWDGKKRTYSPQPDNYEDFFQTGYTLNNALSLDAAGENTSVRFSIADLRTREIIENSKFNRTNLGLNLAAKLLKDFEIKTYVAYVHQKVDNRYGLSDNKENPSRNYIMMPRNISNESLRNNLTNENGEEQAWYMNWAWQGNPFYATKYIYNGDVKDRVFGHASLTWHLNEKTDFMIRTAPDYSFIRFEQHNPVGARTSTLGSYSENETRQFLINTDFLITFRDEINEDFSYTLNAGGNAMYQRTKYYSGYTNGGLIVPGEYSLENSLDAPYQHTTPAYEKAINSLYAFGQLDFRHYLFLDVTGRNDWSSTLPEGNNAYFYPSVSLGFAFTDLMNLSKKSKDIFSFGKLRASYAEVGNDTEPYQLNPTFFIDSVSNIFGTIAYISNQVAPLDLKPERIKSIELGTDLRFFMNRVSLDFTWYKTNAVNQILSADISQSSGSTTALINAGNIENRGIEMQLKVNPVKTTGFSWDFTFNYTRNRSEVIGLTQGLDNLQILEHWNLSIEARPGHPYGDIVGYAILKDENGNRLVDANGMYIRNEIPQVLGNVNPDFSMSYLNNMSYKAFSLSFLVDARIGGEMFAGTNLYGYGYSGNFTETLEGREEWYASEVAREAAGITPDEWTATGGYLAEGVYADGTVIDGVDVSGQPNQSFVNPQYYWDQFSDWTNEIHEPFVYDASFVKLREVVLSYNFPAGWFSSIGMTNASVSLYGRNLWLIHKNVPNIDPETFHTNGNGQGYELYSYPNKRSVGFSLNVKF